MAHTTARRIRSISVKNLFGMYDYSLGDPEANREDGRILILYGDNGSGKTTIMKLAFHLLASEEKEGHKSYAARIPFQQFSVVLEDGTTVWAGRPSERLTGSFSMGIRQPGKKESTFDFVADTEGNIRSGSEQEELRYRDLLAKLRALGVGLYMLSDDRQLHIANRDRHHPMAHDYALSEEIEFLSQRERRVAIEAARIAHVLLSGSMKTAEFWIRSHAMQASSQGESSVNALYNDMLKRLSEMPNVSSLDNTITKKSIQERIAKLETECEDFAKYGLMPEFSGAQILDAIEAAPSTHLAIMARVLSPYLESLEKKLGALRETYRRVHAFVSVINGFLTNKTLTFDVHSGIRVTARNDMALEPHMLSSGERHLLLLFCNSLAALDRPSIMMIDEPEISLNVKWQRSLLSSLQECIGDSPVQYVFATHSMELLASHRDKVVKLENRRSK